MKWYKAAALVSAGAMAVSLMACGGTKGKEPADWSWAYAAEPKFYTKQGGSPFGAVALTEDTETILSKTPQEEYAVGGKQVADWKMILASTTKEEIIGECDYFKALEKLEKHILDTKENRILVKGLSLAELEELAQ